MRPLRLLHLNSARKYVGEAAHAVELCRVLGERGHQVDLAVRRGHALEERARLAGVSVLGLRMSGRFNPVSGLLDARRIIRHCRERGVQVLHAHRGKDHWLAAAARALGRLPVPLVRTRHVIKTPRSHAANRWLARRTALVVCVSEEVRRRMTGSGLYRPEKLAVVRTGVDLVRFAPGGDRAAVRESIGMDATAPLAVMVARYHPMKGHAYLIDAAERVLRELPSARFLLLGKGPGRAGFEELVRSRGMHGAVRFLGWRDDVAEIIRAADVGVLASVGSEGCSRAVMEYMASGLAVVATRAGAVPELVRDGETGFLVPMRDAEALAGALSGALGALERSREMGLRGRRMAEEELGLDGWAARMEELYDGLLGVPAAEGSH